MVVLTFHDHTAAGANGSQWGESIKVLIPQVGILTHVQRTYPADHLPYHKKSTAL